MQHALASTRIRARNNIIRTVVVVLFYDNALAGSAKCNSWRVSGTLQIVGRPRVISRPRSSLSLYKVSLLDAVVLVVVVDKRGSCVLCQVSLKFFLLLLLLMNSAQHSNTHQSNQYTSSSPFTELEVNKGLPFVPGQLNNGSDLLLLLMLLLTVKEKLEPLSIPSANGSLLSLSLSLFTVSCLLAGCCRHESKK